jgi:hypothetical protein
MPCELEIEFTSHPNFVLEATDALLMRLTYLTPMAATSISIRGVRVAMQARNTVCMSEYPVPNTQPYLPWCPYKNSTLLARKLPGKEK